MERRWGERQVHLTDSVQNFCRRIVGDTAQHAYSMLQDIQLTLLQRQDILIL